MITSCQEASLPVMCNLDISCLWRQKMNHSLLSNPCEQDWMFSCMDSSINPTLNSGLSPGNFCSSPMAKQRLRGAFL